MTRRGVVAFLLLLAFLQSSCAAPGSGDELCSEQEHAGDLSLGGRGGGDQLEGTGYRRIAGNLVIEGLDVVELRLSCLEEVEGGISILQNSVTLRVSMPALQRVGGAVLVMHNELLAELSLPLLVEAGGLRMDRNPALSSLHFDSLHSIGGGITVGHSPSLEELLLPALEGLGQSLWCTTTLLCSAYRRRNCERWGSGSVSVPIHC
jgi:hypothetical protein